MGKVTKPKIIDYIDCIRENDYHFKLFLKSNVVVIGGDCDRGKRELANIINLIRIMGDEYYPELDDLNKFGTGNLGIVKNRAFALVPNLILDCESGWPPLEDICGTFKNKFIVLEEADYYLNRKLADLIVNNRKSQYLIFSRGHWFDNNPNVSYGEFIYKPSEIGTDIEILYVDKECEWNYG